VFCKAMVDEDRLLSRLGLLENQLSVYAKVERLMCLILTLIIIVIW